MFSEAPGKRSYVSSKKRHVLYISFVSCVCVIWFVVQRTVRLQGKQNNIIINLFTYQRVGTGKIGTMWRLICFEEKIKISKTFMILPEEQITKHKQKKVVYDVRN